MNEGLDDPRYGIASATALERQGLFTQFREAAVSVTERTYLF